MITEPLNRVLERRTSLMLLAYIGYQVRGRGTVVVMTDVRPNLSKASYLTESDWDIGDPDSFDDEMLDLVRTYNPERELILIEVSPDDEWSIHHITVVGDSLNARYRHFRQEQPVASA